MKKVPIAIWGCGNVGKTFYEKHKDEYDVVCFFDNNPSHDIYDNIPILRYNKEYKTKWPMLMIVIASDLYLHEIEEQLKQETLRKGKDYVPYTYLDNMCIPYFLLNRECETKDDIEYFLCWLKRIKKLAVFYGNCQITMLRILFNCNELFKKKYFIVAVPEVYDYRTKEDLDILKNMIAWKYCDLLISQRVSRNNRFSPELATEKIESYINKNTVCVWIPNVYFKGYCPQSIRNKNNVDLDIHLSGKFPLGDKFVEQMISEGMKHTEILERICRDNFLEEEYIQNKIDESFLLLEKKELECDVHISDYIKRHYKDRQLFYSENHPCNEVLIELVKRILEKIGLNTELIGVPEENMEFTLRGQDIPIYPSVRKYLHLTDEMDYWANRYYWEFHGDFVEFYRMYLDVCFQ